MSSLALAKTYVGSLEALSAQARAYAAHIYDLFFPPPGR